MAFFTVYWSHGQSFIWSLTDKKERIQDRMKGLPGNTENKNKEQCIVIKYGNIASEKENIGNCSLQLA